MTEGQPVKLCCLDDVRGSGDITHFKMRNRLQESASKFTCETVHHGENNDETRDPQCHTERGKNRHAAGKSTLFSTETQSPRDCEFQAGGH